MIEQIANAIAFYGFFTESKVGKTGLTVTVDVWRINTSGSATEVVTAGSATEVGDGLYRYTLVSGSVTVEGEYVAIFKTSTTTVDQQHIPALWVVNKAGVENLADIESGITPGTGLTNDSGAQLTAISPRQAWSIMLSSLAGALSGVATNAPVFKPGGKPAGDNRISAAQAADGRTTVALQVPD